MADRLNLPKSIVVGKCVWGGQVVHVCSVKEGCEQVRMVQELIMFGWAWPPPIEWAWLFPIG